MTQQNMAATAQASAPIPFKRGPDPVDSALGGGALGLLLVSLAAIGAVLYLRRRLNLGAPAGRPAASRIRVLESQRLGPRTVLSVVAFNGREYLLAQTEQGIVRLADTPPAGAPGDQP